MNDTTLTGTLVSDPTRGETPHGPVVTARLAFHITRPTTTRGFVDVAAYDDLAPVLARLGRGARVVLAGELGFEECGPRGERRSRNLIVATGLDHVGQAPTGPRAA